MEKEAIYEGPDLSVHNDVVNIQAIRDAGYGRIGLRAGYGRNNTDPMYDANAQACHTLGVKVLVYWFSYAYTVEMAQNEAKFACSHVGKYWSRCPIAYDFEDDSVRYAQEKGVNVTKDLSTRMAIVFLNEVKSRGYIPVLYTNKNYMQHYFDLGRIRAEVSDVRIWYAHYEKNLSPEELEIADVWQYTDQGKVPGVQKNADVNKFYIELD